MRHFYSWRFLFSMIMGVCEIKMSLIYIAIAQWPNFRNVKACERIREGIFGKRLHVFDKT